MGFRLPILACLLLVLSGCASDSDLLSPADSAEGSIEDAGSPPAPTQAVAKWREGDWFAYDVVTERGVQGQLTAVVEATSPLVFAAGERGWAIQEATVDLPLLGTMDPGTLATTAFGGAWDLFQLPISDGETWSATLRIPTAFDGPAETDLLLTAHLAKVPGPGGGEEEGYAIEGVDGTGRVVLQTTYSIARRVPTTLDLYEDPADGPIWRATLQDAGQGWAKSTWTASAAPLVQGYALMAPNETDPASPALAPLEPFEFAVRPGCTAFGYLIAYAFGAAATATVLSPGGKELHAAAAGADMVDVQVVDLPAEEGTWRATATAAGAVGFAGIFLWEVEVEERPPG